MNRAHEPGEAENDRWALAEHLRVGADHAAHVVQCASFTSLPLQEFIAVISQLDTVIISGDKNAAQSDRMFPQDNIAEVWNHHAGPGFRILSTDWYPGMKHTKMQFHKQRRRRGHKGWGGEDWNATDLQWKIETSCVSVCLWCDVRGGLYFFKAVPTTPNDLGLSRPLSLYKWLVWWRFGDQSDLKRTERARGETIQRMRQTGESARSAGFKGS